MQVLGSDLDVFKDRPKLSAWRDRVKKEVGVKLFDETHDQIVNMPSTVKQLDSEGKLEAVKTRFRKAFSQWSFCEDAEIVIDAKYDFYWFVI